jgi:hypothetical protein
VEPGRQRAESATTPVLVIFALSWLAVMVAMVSVPQSLFRSINPDYLAEGLVGGLAAVVLGIIARAGLRIRNAVLLQADRSAVALWSNRLPLSLILTGLCVVTASAFFLIQDFVYSEEFVGPRTRYASWSAYSILVAIDIVCALALVRNVNRVMLNTSGVCFASLWSEELPWTEIAAIRVAQEWDGDALAIDLKRRHAIGVLGPRRLFVASRYAHDGHSLLVPDSAALVPLQVLAAALRKRCDGAALNCR